MSKLTFDQALSIAQGENKEDKDYREKLYKVIESVYQLDDKERTLLNALISNPDVTQSASHLISLSKSAMQDAQKIAKQLLKNNFPRLTVLDAENIRVSDLYPNIDDNTKINIFPSDADKQTAYLVGDQLIIGGLTHDNGFNIDDWDMIGSLNLPNRGKVEAGISAFNFSDPIEFMSENYRKQLISDILTPAVLDHFEKTGEFGYDLTVTQRFADLFDGETPINNYPALSALQVDALEALNEVFIQYETNYEFDEGEDVKQGFLDAIEDVLVGYRYFTNDTIQREIADALVKPLLDHAVKDYLLTEAIFDRTDDVLLSCGVSSYGDSGYGTLELKTEDTFIDILRNIDPEEIMVDGWGNPEKTPEDINYDGIWTPDPHTASLAVVSALNASNALTQNNLTLTLEEKQITLSNGDKKYGFVASLMNADDAQMTVIRTVDLIHSDFLFVNSFDLVKEELNSRGISIKPYIENIFDTLSKEVHEIADNRLESYAMTYNGEAYIIATGIMTIPSQQEIETLIKYSKPLNFENAFEMEVCGGYLGDDYAATQLRSDMARLLDNAIEQARDLESKSIALSELQEFDLITDKQNIEQIIYSFIPKLPEGLVPSNITGIVQEVVDGEIANAWITESSHPYDLKAHYSPVVVDGKLVHEQNPTFVMVGTYSGTVKSVEGDCVVMDHAGKTLAFDASQFEEVKEPYQTLEFHQEAKDSVQVFMRENSDGELGNAQLMYVMLDIQQNFNEGNGVYFELSAHSSKTGSPQILRLTEGKDYDIEQRYIESAPELKVGDKVRISRCATVDDVNRDLWKVEVKEVEVNKDVQR
jgi:hypothetical protein